MGRGGADACLAGAVAASRRTRAGGWPLGSSLTAWSQHLTLWGSGRMGAPWRSPGGRPQWASELPAQAMMGQPPAPQGGLRRAHVSARLTATGWEAESQGPDARVPENSPSPAPPSLCRCLPSALLWPSSFPCRGRGGSCPGWTALRAAVPVRQVWCACPMAGEETGMQLSPHHTRLAMPHLRGAALPAMSHTAPPQGLCPTSMPHPTPDPPRGPAPLSHLGGPTLPGHPAPALLHPRGFAPPA